ncbi:dihydroneopterin aldolase [Pontibacter sp. JAM-7]|uniref:dihydroneopterin aldolase n=1 Tax=Pontibacter sp. JAM-7 TaxID=3366581 RepID=UPI003AF42751
MALPEVDVMDLVYIEGLRVETIIGIYDWERQVKQVVTLDLQLGVDIQSAAETDDIEHALNYKAVSERLVEFIVGSEFLLLEAMAEQVAELLQEEFGVRWLQLKLGKPGAVPQAKTVGVLIERGERF